MSELPTKATDEKFCSECGSIIKVKAEICPKCGVRQFGASAFISNQEKQSIIDKDSLLLSDPEKGKEAVFYKNEEYGVLITKTRFIAGNNHTYAIKGITSIATKQEDPSRMGPLMLIILGVGMLIFAPPTGLLPIILGIFWWSKQKATLAVILHSASGEQKSLSSKDAQFINSVTNSLNDAIIDRG